MNSLINIIHFNNIKGVQKKIWKNFGHLCFCPSKINVCYIAHLPIAYKTKHTNKGTTHKSRSTMSLNPRFQVRVPAQQQLFSFFLSLFPPLASVSFFILPHFPLPSSLCFLIPPFPPSSICLRTANAKKLMRKFVVIISI